MVKDSVIPEFEIVVVEECNCTQSASLLLAKIRHVVGLGLLVIPLVCAYTDVGAIALDSCIFTHSPSLLPKELLPVYP